MIELELKEIKQKTKAIKELSKAIKSLRKETEKYYGEEVYEQEVLSLEDLGVERTDIKESISMDELKSTINEFIGTLKEEEKQSKPRKRKPVSED
jgi:hypothetical protein